MEKENKTFRREKNNNTKKKQDLGIKVGDWFEEIITNWPNPETRCFYYVKYLDYKYTSLIMICINPKSNALIEISCLGWEIELFRRSKKNRLIFNEEVVFENRNEEDVLDQLKKVNAVSLLLTCFGKNEDNLQNQPTSQSTTSENTEKELDIKVGDYYHYSSPFNASFNSSREYYTRVKSVSRLDIGTRFDRYLISGDGFNYTLDNGIPKDLKEEIEQKWKLRIRGGSIKEEDGQKITKEEYDEKLREIKHQLQPETKPTTDSLSKKRIEEPKEKENLNLKVGDWLKGTEYSTCCSLDLESIFFVSKIETDSIFLENARPRNIRLDQSIESEPWNKENFFREEGKIYFKSEDLFIEFKKISKEEVLETLRSWSTTIDWTFKRLISDTQYNKKLMTIENFLEKGIDFSGKCIIVKPLSSGVAACIKVNMAKRGDEVYMNVAHSSIVFYPEIAFEIPIDSKNSCHCRTEKDIMAGKELLYDTHSLIEVISEEEFMTLRNEVNLQNSSSIKSTTPENKPNTAKDLGIKVGDWFEMLQVREESKGMERRFFRAETVNPDKIWFKEVNVIKSPEVENPDADLPLEIDEKPCLIEYFHKNADGTFFWETKDSRRWDFERRDIDVVRKEVTHCLNLENRGILRDLNLLETKSEEKLKKCCYLKYVKDNEVYYLNSPKYETKKILGREKFHVIASGFTIINNRINHHSCNGDALNLIRLMFDNEEEFFNKVTEISEYEYHTLWHDLI